MNKIYQYKPVRFYSIVFIATWALWFTAAVVGHTTGETGISPALMLAGLLAPSVTALCMVMTSKSPALKRELKEKLIGAFRLRPGIIFFAIVIFFGVIVISILLSTFAGQSLNQFAFADFSFSLAGIPSLLTITLAAFLEEMGWRGYAEDSIASYFNWWKESLISGGLWSVWHLPLFFIPGSYQYNILQENPWFMVNFFAGILPLDIIFAWVYVKNERSIFACMFFHFFVNFLQEKIAMTQVTKCVETFVLLIVAAVVVALNKDMFFETRHIGHLLPETDPQSSGNTNDGERVS
jgi:membrane protease YdiL (CAAX protease family)